MSLSVVAYDQVIMNFSLRDFVSVIIIIFFLLYYYYIMIITCNLITLLSLLTGQTFRLRVKQLRC